MSKVFYVEVNGENWEANCGWRQNYNIWSPVGEHFSVLRKDVETIMRGQEVDIIATVKQYIEKSLIAKENLNKFFKIGEI